MQGRGLSRQSTLSGLPCISESGSFCLFNTTSRPPRGAEGMCCKDIHRQSSLISPEPTQSALPTAGCRVDAPPRLEVGRRQDYEPGRIPPVARRATASPRDALVVPTVEI